MKYSHIIIILTNIILLTIGVYIILKLNKPTKENYYLADYWKLKECRCIPKYDEFQQLYNNK